MKKFSFLLLFITMLLSSCLKMPTAEFSFDPVDPSVGEEVFFINRSKDALRFDWDFGNGKSSQEVEPSVVYDKPGTYTIELTARHGLRSNRKSLAVIITQ